MKNAVICFTRVPRPGKTKTRLLPILSGENCAGLHTAFLQDLATVYEAVNAHLFVAYTEDPGWEMLQSIFPTAKEFFPQVGGDLGEKMANAIRHVLSLGYEECILTGSDLPQITAEHLRPAFDALKDADIVIGPTKDGGYYLIGMKKLCLSVFQNQQYGGANVYENTLAAAKAAGFTVATAPTCGDVDTPDDLRYLADHCDPNSHTGQYLKKLREDGILL